MRNLRIENTYLLNHLQIQDCISYFVFAFSESTCDKSQKIMSNIFICLLKIRL